MFVKIHITFYGTLFLAALILFVFIANPANYYFLNDDFVHIPLASQKRFIRSGLLRPLSDFTLWMDYTIWHQNAFGYHLTNSLIHLANSILVFFVCRNLFHCFAGFDRHEILKRSALSATLFLIYAYHSESIFWIIGRGASLCTLFFLTSLFFYLKGKNTVLNYVVSLLSFFIGLLAYETIWVFPLIVSMMHMFALKRNIWHVAGVWAVFLIYMVLRFWIAPVSSGDYQLGVLNNLNFFKLFYNYNALLARCFLPPAESNMLFLCSYAGLTVVLIFICIKWRNDTMLLFSIICLLLSLLPVVFLGIDTHDTESERFIYLGSFFAILFLVQTFSHLCSRIALPMGLALLLSHAYLLYNAASHYRIASTITKQSLQCIPTHKLYNNIYTINLPTQYKGALIFRSGLKEAIFWINDVQLKRVKIVSVGEVYKSVSVLQCKKIRVDGGANDPMLLKGYVIPDWKGNLGLVWEEGRLIVIE
jgi:hypothetical protein